MLRLVSVLLLLLPTFALAQLPTYTLIDLGPADDPNGLAPPSADCLGTPAGNDGAGNPVYQCRSWAVSSNGSSLYTNSWVGYAQLPAQNSQPLALYRRPVEYLQTCCGEPPPNEGLNALPMPPGESEGAEATSLSVGADYIVGHSTHLFTTSSGGSALVRRAAVWDHLTPYNLPALAGNDSSFDSAAYAVSSSGEVVGESTIPLNAGGYATRATIWLNRMAYELQYMLSPRVSVILTTARWIDCEGNIVAQGWPASYGSTPPETTTYPHDYLLVRQGSPRSNCPP